MSERLNACFGCGAAAPSISNFCEHCQKKLELDADEDQIVSSNTFDKLEIGEEMLVRIIQKELLFKSFILTGMIGLIVLAHPALAFLQSAAHQICRITSFCPLS